MLERESVRKKGTKAPSKGPISRLLTRLEIERRCEYDHLFSTASSLILFSPSSSVFSLIKFPLFLFFFYPPTKLMNSSAAATTIMLEAAASATAGGGVGSSSSRSVPPVTGTGGTGIGGGSVTTTTSATAQTLSRYESQKRRDWNTFGQYLKNQRPPVSVSQCNYNHVLEFLRYLDQFGKTKVHLHGCVFFGQPDPPAPCTCPLRQAWGSLDALIGRLRAAYEENGGTPETNPFGNGAIRVYLREVKECQAKARGIPYKKKKKKKINPIIKNLN